MIRYKQLSPLMKVKKRVFMTSFSVLMSVIMLLSSFATEIEANPIAPQGASGLLSGDVGYIEADLDPLIGRLANFGYQHRIELDYKNRSIGIDLGVNRTVNTLELNAESALHRLKKMDLSLYVSDDNITYTKVKDWDFLNLGEKIILFNFSVQARYVKIHNHFHDNGGTFYNSQLKQMVQAFHLPSGRWTAGNGGSWAYKLPIQVVNSNNETIYDRAVYVTKDEVDLDGLISLGKMQADYRDIRFANDSGTELHYYMDDNGFFVRIPVMEPLETQSIHMYYGNSDASFRGDAEEAIEVTYGNKTLQVQDGELKPARLKDGTLMLLAGSDDRGIVAQYSFNGGKTWTNQETLLSPITNGEYYEYPLGSYVDPDTGEMILLVGVSYIFTAFDGINNCLDIADCRNDMFVVKSTGFSNGKPMFGAPQQLTDYTTADNHPIHYLLTYTNPIRTSTGRIIAPFSYVISNDGMFAASVLYSDDDGITWEKSGSELTVPSIGGEGGITEVAVMELSDGTLKLYYRQQRSDLYYLGTSSSTDQGATWSAPTDSEILSVNTFPAALEDSQGNIVLNWSGHNAMGAGSYYRNNLTVAYSDDDTLTWKGYLDLLGRTVLSTPGWNIAIQEHTLVTQSDKVQAGDDAWLFSWAGWSSTNSSSYSVLVDDFERYLYRSHGALDHFEYENTALPAASGSRLANDYWWKTTSNGLLGLDNTRVKAGSKSMRIEDNAGAGSLTGASRLFPASRKGTVKLSLNGESFSNELYLSLQEGYSQHWNALGAGFILRIDQDGKLQYTNTAVDSSSTEAIVGFLNNDDDPLTGNLGHFPDRYAFAFDYRNTSVGVDLGHMTTLRNAKLLPEEKYMKTIEGQLGTRVNEENLEVYVSNTNNGDWQKVDGWGYEKIGNDITLDFTGLNIQTRFVKVHQNYPDDEFTFAADQQAIMTVETEDDMPIEFFDLPEETMLPIDEWTDISLDFDLFTNTAEVFVNEDSKGIIEAAHPGEVINHMMIATGEGSGTIVYIDEFMMQDKEVQLPTVNEVGEEETAIEAVDDTAPTITFSINGNEVEHWEANVTVSVSDDWSGVDSALLLYTWLPTGKAPTDLSWQPFVNGQELQITNRNGDWHLHVKAADLAGNESVIISERFRLKNPNGSGGGGGNSAESGSNGSGNGNESNHPISNDLAASIVIPDGQSGIVGIDDTFMIVFPKGSFADETKIDTRELATEPQRALLAELEKGGGTVLSAMIEVNAEQHTLQKKATVVMSFNKAGNQNVTPTLFRYDLDLKQWIEVPGTLNEDTISAAVTKIGIFAVIGMQKKEEEESPTDSVFKDISEHWARVSIEKALGLSFIQGYEDGTFRPDYAVTREEFIVMIDRAIGIGHSNQEQALDKQAFVDGELISSWAMDAVGKAQQWGIVEGFDDQTFRPQQNITRTEMIMMIVRAMQRDVAHDRLETSYSDDAAIPAWAKSSVAAATEVGWIEGRENNAFAPQEKLTRAEAITMIMRLVK